MCRLKTLRSSVGVLSARKKVSQVSKSEIKVERGLGRMIKDSNLEMQRGAKVDGVAFERFHS